MIKVFEHLPHNKAAENNKAAILSALKQLNLSSLQVFEIGSGTGQHGIYFCQNMLDMQWQPSETEDNLPLTQAWYNAAQAIPILNYQSPISFAIGNRFPNISFNTIYSANVLHIVQTDEARTLIEQASQVLSSGQRFVCYGPFKVNGEFTTESNHAFNDWLQQQGFGGLIDIADIEYWSKQQLKVTYQIPMPANNFLLVFEKE